MEIYQLSGIQLKKDTIIERLEGDKTPALSEELGNKYEKLLLDFQQCITPEFRIEIKKEEKKAYILFSLGKKISEKIEEEMKQGNVMDALILDAMADTYLFQMDSQGAEITKESFAEMNLGVKQRLNPGVEIPLSEQEKILEKVKKPQEFVQLTKGYVFEPVKTLGYILQLTENKEIFKMQHDCSKCNNLQCKMRGKLFLEENPKASFAVVVNEGNGQRQDQQENMKPPFQVAIDLGTTTIAMQLLAGEKAVPVKTYTAVNSCRRFGSDVITRIQNANNGGLYKLQKLSQTDILKGIKALCEAAEITMNAIERIGIAGNTTVSQIFLGQSLQGLAAYPFQPFTCEIQKLSFSEVFESKESQAEVIIFPPVSAFVGGDIVSGLFQCGFLSRKRPAMLIDIGTNGEMVIGDSEHLLCTSVAAGPAFEGGGLRNGVGSVSGAISAFELQGNRGKVTTIHEKSPIGICGTGMVEILSELKDARILKQDGNLLEQYLNQGYEVAKTESGNPICVYQQDIRELQLAKGAIGAGIELLVKAYGKTYREIPEVFVAGGFGYRMNIRKAVNIGIFPKEFLGKIKTVGNTSLAGVESFLRDGQAEEKLKKITEISKEVVLAKTEEFQQTYMKHLNL
ncbi:MAG: DUF4445 domain-containing protein [Lachnospiraceae bacterium]|nr:DUF4445 domain-containing protein [Lachnospiraceae bacterium]